jgi:hypothetical protein
MRVLDWAINPASGTTGAYAFVAIVLTASWAAMMAGVAVIVLACNLLGVIA